MSGSLTVYLVRENSDNADILSAHRTLEGAKRAAEQAAAEQPLPDDMTRTWHGDPAADEYWLEEGDPLLGTNACWIALYQVITIQVQG